MRKASLFLFLAVMLLILTSGCSSEEEKRPEETKQVSETLIPEPTIAPVTVPTETEADEAPLPTATPEPAPQPTPTLEPAETTKTNPQLYLDIAFTENVLFSRYDIDVYLDDQKVGVIPHGKHFTYLTEVSEGRHTLAFYNSNNHNVNTKKSISVTEETTFQCTPQAHSDEIAVGNVETLHSISGTSITMDDVAGLRLINALNILQDSGFVNITATSDEGSIIDNNNWIVISQNVEPGSQQDKNIAITLTCNRMTTYMDDNFKNLTLPEGEKRAAELGYQSTLLFNALNSEDIGAQIKETSADDLNKWEIDRAVDISSDEKKLEFYLSYSGTVTVPKVTSMSLQNAMELLQRNYFSDISIKTEDDSWVMVYSNWEVISQSIEAGQLVPANKSIALLCRKYGSEKPAAPTSAVTESPKISTAPAPSATPTIVASFSQEIAQRAAVVAMTNYLALDVLTADGNSVDPSKFHSYADTSGSPENYFQYVTDWGSWRVVDEDTWHVNGLEIKSYSLGTEKRLAMDVAFDGTNYVISNVEDRKGTTSANTTIYEASDPSYTVSPALVEQDRVQSEVDKLDHSGDIPDYQARRAFEYMGNALYPYGFECHWWTQNYRFDQSWDGSWTIKVGVTITNKYGASIDATAEAYINNVTQCVENFVVY